MAIKTYRVTLTESERTELQQLIGTGVTPAHTLARARILLKADQSPTGRAWTDGLDPVWWALPSIW